MSESKSDDTAVPTMTKKLETKNKQENKTVSPPWYAKTGVMASIKYTQPAMTHANNNTNQSQPASHRAANKPSHQGDANHSSDVDTKRSQENAKRELE